MLKLGNSEPARVVIQYDFRLNDQQIDEALAGNAGARWYHALVQLIDGLREDNLMNASRSASTGNTHAMAGGLNVYEAFTALLAALDEKVNRASD